MTCSHSQKVKSRLGVCDAHRGGGASVSIVVGQCPAAALQRFEKLRNAEPLHGKLGSWPWQSRGSRPGDCTGLQTLLVMIRQGERKPPIGETSAAKPEDRGQDYSVNQAWGWIADRLSLSQ